MSAFDLDEQGQARVDEWASANLLTDAPPEKPGMFDGALEATGSGIMRGGAKAADFLMTFLGKQPAMSEQQERTNELADTLQDEQVKSAVDLWTPNANEVGKVGQVLGGFSEMVLPLLASAGDPAILIGTNTLAAGKEQIDAGVDGTTASINAAITGASTYAGFKMPFLGKSLTAKMVSGALGNTAINAATTAAQREILQAGGYDELAQKYDPFDVEARAIDLLTGVAFGGLDHYLTPSDVGAIAAGGNAKHFQTDTAPGHPLNLRDSVAHQEAMEASIEQILTDQPVSVPIQVTSADFVPRPETAPVEIPAELVALDEARGIETLLTVDDAITADGPAPETFKIVRDGSGNVAAMRITDGHMLDLSAAIKAGMSVEEALAVQTSHSQSAEHVKPAEDSVKSRGDSEPEDGYSVAEGVLTDEQLAQFEGLRSQVQADEVVGGPGEGAPESQGRSNDGEPRGEPLRVYRGAARELGPEDFRSEALGHATGHPSSGLGVFFTNAAGDASRYGPVSEHFLDVRNPKVISVEDLPGFDSLAEANAFRKALEAEGHDGMVIDASHLGGPVNYVAFAHEQVKQAPTSKAKKTAARKPPAKAEGEPPPPDVTAAQAHLASNDILIPTGELDAEGAPVTRSARELMAEAEAEIAQAEADAVGYEAAVNCFLSRGADAT